MNNGPRHMGTVRNWRRHWATALIVGMCIGGGMVSHASPTAYAVHDLGEVRKAVSEFLYASNGSVASPDHVEVGVVDSRLRLARCGQPLKLFFSAGGATSGNTTVGVRCLGPSPWLIYVPGRIKLYRTVVVTERAVPRKTVLSKEDIKLEQRDVSNLTAGYLEESDHALGRVTRRPMPIGSVIEPAALENQRLVRRGERVTILANAGRLTVQMKGKALMDGASGDHVRVKNLSSGRVIEGTVTASGTIHVRH